MAIHSNVGIGLMSVLAFLSVIFTGRGDSISYNDLFIIDCTIEVKMVTTGEVKESFQCSNIDLFNRDTSILSFNWNSCPLDNTSPRNACNQVKFPPSNVSRIALVPSYVCRGQKDCELLKKAKSLSNGPYKAFISWEDIHCSQAPDKSFAGGSSLDTINNTDPSVIAIVVTKTKALDLQVYTNSTQYVVDVSISLWKFGDLLLTFMGVFLGTTACMCAWFCCFFALRVCVNRPRTTTLSNRELNRNTRRIKYRAREGADETCSICLEEFTEGELVRELPCKHLYHNQCVDTWLKKYNALCPNCKTSIKSKRKRSDEEAPLLAGAEQEGSQYGATATQHDTAPSQNNGVRRVVMSSLDGRESQEASDSDQESDSINPTSLLV